MGKNLPTVNGLPRDLQQFVQRVREALDGNGLDSAVTTRQLVAAGIAGFSTGTGVITSTGGTVGSPRAPTNLTAVGALASIIVSWEGPAYSGHSYTEVWAAEQSVAQASASEAPLVVDAVLVGMNAGNSFSHQIGSAGTRYYWVRNINQNGIASAYNATAGLVASTGTDPALLLALLTEVISDSQLATALKTRIDLIDAGTAVSGSVDARISTEATNTTNQLALKANASVVTALSSTVGSNTAAIQTVTNSTGGLNAQYTVKIDNNGHVSGFGLASTAVDGARVSDFIVAANRFSVASPVNHIPITGIHNGSGVFPQDNGNGFPPVSFRELKVAESAWNAYTFVAGDQMTLTGFTADNIYEIMAKVTHASRGKLIRIRAGSIDGQSTCPQVSTNGFATIELAMAAQYPNVVGKINYNEKTPFVIATTNSTINGVTVPAGTYIDTAMIGDATIKNASINSLTADKITASLLNTVDFYGNTIAGSTIYLGGTVNYSQTGGANTGISGVSNPAVTLDSNGATFNVAAFRVNNLNGAAVETPFQVVGNHVYIKAANIQDATITNAKIANGAIDNAKIGNIIQSANYSSGSAGWKIDKAGQMEMNNATFRGTLNVTSSASSSTSRLEITGTTIKVFEGSTLRVKLGNLA